MLVVVHEHDCVGVGGELFSSSDEAARDVDVEAEVARMEIGIELLNEGEIGGKSVFVQIFDSRAKGRDSWGRR